ncbi:MAG: IclR family transcriptional regulator [Paracoccus sp. (in: a-proteobacteria)]|nr:IclR family transcriptional regulator [Paracoccus sp. (in: a-proteobacteria)]
MTSQMNGSVLRAFRILDLFRDGHSEINAAIVSERLDLNAVTAHRFLRSLEVAGALVAVSRGNYRLGFALADLGARAAEPDGISGIVQPALESLTRQTREGAMATVFDGEMAVCISRAVPDRPLFVDVRPGTRLDAWCTAHGKIWLASLSQLRLNEYIDRQKLPFPASRLLNELDQVRQTRVAYNRSERESDISAIAVPVHSRTGAVICGVSVYGPSARLTEPVLQGLVPMLTEAARDIEQKLYGRGDNCG